MRLCAGLIVLFSMGLSLTSAQDDQDSPVPLDIIYKQRTIEAQEGSVVPLLCRVVYDLEKCEDVHVVWQRNSEELTDPRKYLTTVMEWHSGRSGRERHVVTEILRVRPSDSGIYQCMGHCGGRTAMGHFITVEVQDALLD